MILQILLDLVQAAWEWLDREVIRPLEEMVSCLFSRYGSLLNFPS